MLSLLVILTTLATGLLPVQPAAAVADTLPPSVPTNPHWSDDFGLLTETISGNTTIQASWTGSTDDTAGSGMAQYHLQLSQTPDFLSVMVDTYTGSTATTYSFSAADGIAAGHSYYFRVSALDVNGNQSAFSGPSNRVDVSDQQTGPKIVHQPILTAYFGQPIPISLYATCEGAGPCAARLFYRTTGSASIPTGAWQRVDLTRGSSLQRVNNTDAFQYTGTIPGWAVTTQGVDYYLEAEDTFALGYYPGTTFVDGTYVVGLQGTYTYAHIQTIAPPVITHVPPAYVQADTTVHLSMDATCSTGNCQATMYFRTSTDSVLDQPLLAIPNWPSVQMQAQPNPVDLGQAGKRVTYTADIPSSYVDTRGVDYFFHVVDGYTEAFWPGTTHQGYYVPTDGQRITWHHIHALEPPHIVHEAVAASPYRQPIAIQAQANCPSTRSCTATLYYRTTTSGVLDTAQVFATTPMSVTKLSSANGNDVISVNGTIPGSVADTRGVDYFFSVYDGTTTSWWPGTSAVDGYVPMDGVRVGYQHTRVLEPPHIAPVAIPAAPALQDLTIDAEVTCATEHCDVTLYHTGKLTNDALVADDATFTSRPMTDLGLVTTTTAGRVNHYQTTIPAAQVTTRGVAYFIEAKDGYTKSYSPGTFYSGAYVVTDGTRFGCTAAATGSGGTGTGDGTLTVTTDDSITGCATQLGAHVVRVLEPPHTVHVPIAVADVGTPQAITALSNCSTPLCTATLHWRPTYGTWRSAVMASTPQAVGLLGTASVNQYAAVIPASDVTADGFQYYIDTTDGYVDDATLTYSPEMRGTDQANYPPGMPDYPDPYDGALVYTAPTQLSARYLDPEGMPGTLDIELVDATGNPVASGTTGEVPSGSRGTLTIPALADGAYRWRARATDSLGAQSPWTNYWTLAVLSDNECARFVALWAPRVKDADYVETLRQANGYPADILAEGFHAFDETAKRALIDCLFNALTNDEPLPTDTAAADVTWMKDMLYKLIFDKANLPPEVTNSLDNAVQQSAQTITGAPADTLNTIKNAAMAPLPDPLNDPLGAPIPSVRDLIPQSLLQDGGFPATLALPEAQTIVDQSASHATAILPQVQSTVNQVVSDTRLPAPIIAPFTELVRTAIQLTTYRACYESPTVQPTCTAVVPLGTPVPVDVTGDGTLDVTMQLTPALDLNDPLSVNITASVKKLLTSEKPSGGLKAHVWFIYDVANANKRLRLGFDGWHRGDSLADQTNLTFKVRNPLTTGANNLDAHYSLTHTAAPATWALTVGWSSIVPPDSEADPLVGSVQFSPVPASISGDLVVKRQPITGGESRDLTLTASSSVATKVDAIVVNTTTSATPVRQDALEIVVNKLPTTASINVHQDKDQTHTLTHVISDMNAPIPIVQVTGVAVPDVSKPTTYDVVVGDLRDVPSHVDVTLNQNATALDVQYSAASVMTRATLLAAAVNQGALTMAGLAQADSIPTNVHVNAGGDVNTGVQAVYTANGSLAKLLLLYYDARNKGTALIGQAQSLPTSITASGSIQNRTLSMDANGPIGMIDLKASRNGAPVFVLGGDHATLIANPAVDQNTIGVSAHITGLQHASLALNSKLEAHTVVSPGGQPFQMLAYLNNTELGYASISNLPSTVDLTGTISTTAPAASYRASAVINQMTVYYTNLSSGPTLAAALNSVPSAVDLTATLGDPAKLTYSANAVLGQIVLVASPVSALKLDTATSPYLIALAQSVPASVTASMDLNDGNYSWNASSTTPLAIIAAKGIPPVPSNAAVVLGATGIPTQMTGTVSLANRTFTFRGLTGPVGRVILYATNHGTVTAFPGLFLNANYDARSSQWDASASLTDVSAASVVIGSDFKTGTASLSADLHGQPLIFALNYTRSEGIQFGAIGVALNFPSWLQVSLQQGKLTYSSNANMTAAFRAWAGWIPALGNIPDPPWVLGASVRDGACTQQQACGGTTSDFCTSNTNCLGFKAAVYAYGLPTGLNLDWAGNSYSLTNFAPPAPGRFDVFADVEHVLPVPLIAYLSQEGIPAGVNIAVNNLKLVTKKDSRPFHIAADMTASQSLGRLRGWATVPKALNGQDINGYLEVSTVGTSLGIDASLGGSAEAHIHTGAFQPTVFMQGQTKINGINQWAQMYFAQVPSTIDMSVVRTTSSPLWKTPKLNYSASGSSLDGYVWVDGGLTTDVGPVSDVTITARILAGFTNLAASTSMSYNLDTQSIVATSGPVATTQLWAEGSFSADTDRKTYHDSRSFGIPFSTIRARFDLDAAFDLGPSGVDEVLVVMDQLTDIGVRTHVVPISFTITGHYGDTIVFVDGVHVKIDELSAKLTVRPDYSFLSWLKVSWGFSISPQFTVGLAMHLMKNIQTTLVAFDIDGIGPLPCWALKDRPTEIAKAPQGWGIEMFGSDGDQELWFDPWDLVPDALGDIAVAQFLTYMNPHGLNISGC